MAAAASGQIRTAATPASGHQIRTAAALLQVIYIIYII
jgi:hypothetical protein